MIGAIGAIYDWLASAEWKLSRGDDEGAERAYQRVIDECTKRQERIKTARFDRKQNLRHMARG